MQIRSGKRNGWCRLLIGLALLTGVMFGADLTSAREVPPLTARVNDYAAMLSPATRQQLESVLAALEKDESTQLVVLTINSLDGENLEEYSLKVVEKWQLGQKGIDNGALLLIAKNDRKLRIEVGYGLEGVLTDLTSGRIIRDIITPKFRNGNFDQGVIDGVSAMIAAVRGEFSGKNIIHSGKSSDNDLAGFVVFLFFILFNIGRVVGRHKLLAATIGAAIAPVIGGLFFGFQWVLLLALIPAGFLASYLASLFLGTIGSSSGRRPGGFRGHSSGGFSGGGGFGGGGGGFGGGGSSGGW
ncbi:MAG: TPM domain-containing protein [Desulforhopalus sp.]